MSVPKQALTAFARFLEVKTYTADGAIDLRPHRAELDGSSATAQMTLAAPGADLVGTLIIITAIDVSNTVDCDFTRPSGAVTATFAAVGDTLILYGATATDWEVVTTPSGGIA